MITFEQETHILKRGYVPEHSVRLMSRVSGGEPFIIDGCLCLKRKSWIIVVGYPIDREFRSDLLEETLNKIKGEFRAARISLIAPELPASIAHSCRERETDFYYTLNLHETTVRSGLKRAVDKARKDLSIERAAGLTDAHEGLIREFESRADLPPRVKRLFRRMPDYVGQEEGGIVLNAWDAGGRLSAFYVLDTALERFASYVIGAHSKINYVKGASDALFFEMMSAAREWGKDYLQLGLGVNRGIRQYKKKWGGQPTIPYEMCELVLRESSIIESVLEYVGGR
jgi:hypothetical protein